MTHTRHDWKIKYLLDFDKKGSEAVQLFLMFNCTKCHYLHSHGTVVYDKKNVNLVLQKTLNNLMSDSERNKCWEKISPNCSCILCRGECNEEWLQYAPVVDGIIDLTKGIIE